MSLRVSPLPGRQGPGEDSPSKRSFFMWHYQTDSLFTSDMFHNIAGSQFARLSSGWWTSRSQSTFLLTFYVLCSVCEDFSHLFHSQGGKQTGIRGEGIMAPSEVRGLLPSPCPSFPLLNTKWWDLFISPSHGMEPRGDGRQSWLWDWLAMWKGTQSLCNKG